MLIVKSYDQAEDVYVNAYFFFSTFPLSNLIENVYNYI